MTSVDRAEVLAFRVTAQQLDREAGTVADTAVLDLGVQDTGTDGGLWALANRGVDVTGLPGSELVMAWTLRGAPHFYRRADLPSVAAAVQPWSDADAGKRIFDASRPLKAAGIGNLAALDAVATAMRDLVTTPMGKGDVSREMTRRMPEPYLRFCRPCDTTHMYEMTFRLGTLRAGLELQPGTSPPLLQRAAGLTPAAASEQHDPIRAYLRLLGPATPKSVAAYVDAPVAEVKARWPEDVDEVEVEGEKRWVLREDADRLRSAAPGPGARLLGPFDLFLQARDRPLLVDHPARAKALWPVLGRPGAVLTGGRITGTWRPRAAGGRLTVRIDLWEAADEKTLAAIDRQAERLAAHRQVRLAGVEYA